ncbi:MAG: M20/M25/M40 family metallo-hydrolase [Kiritimatiellae bacterium]|nr:M20/M25/M40 family metallo-hydrolase [Kiritimatiellia bacterium]
MQDASKHPAVILLTELLAIPAPGGREQDMAALLVRKVKALGFAAETDPAGNIVVRIGRGQKRKPLVMLAAHMDEIALVVTRIESDGRLCVVPSGGLLPHKIGERPLDIIGDEAVVTGVLQVGLSGHSVAADRAISWDDCHILTGLTPAELDQAGIRPGSSAAPTRAQRGPVLLGPRANPFLAAWTFDDRMGCVTLLRLLEAIHRGKIAPDFPLIVAFTVHEEGGCHGAKVLAHREQPEVFIAVDGCPITPEAPLILDGRPGVWSKDKVAHYDQPLLHDLCRMARAAGTELQPVVYKTAASDASMVLDAGGASRIGFIGHVRENSHGFEMARLAVFDNVLKTLLVFVRKWQG